MQSNCHKSEMKEESSEKMEKMNPVVEHVLTRWFDEFEVSL